MTAFPLFPWQNFYVIVGSSAAALIGVQFVVVTLIVAMRRRPNAETIDAFGTPTVVHLAVALLVSALMTTPWHTLAPPSVAIAIAGLAGLGYGAVVIRRARRQKGYEPVLEDWLWHAILPCSAYAALAVAALFLSAETRVAVCVVGAAALALLFIGIHNAWDAVTHMVASRTDGDAARRE